MKKSKKQDRLLIIETAIGVIGIVLVLLGILNLLNGRINDAILILVVWGLLIIAWKFKLEAKK